MKRFSMAAGLLLGVTLAIPATAQAPVNINIGSQPVWGSVSYDYVEYYYLPDIDIYYHVPTQQYVYLANRHWVYSRILPPHLRYYDFYRGYKVVINEPRPYRYHDRYRRNYGYYRGRMGQPVIRDSRDTRYFDNLDHPQHNQPRYVTRDQYYRHDRYHNHYEPDDRRQNERIHNKRRDDRNDYDNRFRNEINNRFHHDQDSRNCANDNRFRRSENQFREDANQFRNDQQDRNRTDNRNNRSRYGEQ